MYMENEAAQSSHTVQKLNLVQVNPRVINSPHLSRDTPVKVTLVARPKYTLCYL
jgi:hypothetical protein